MVHGRDAIKVDYCIPSLLRGWRMGGRLESIGPDDFKIAAGV